MGTVLSALLRRPGYLALVVVTLALAGGANVAILSIVSAGLATPLPVGEPDRLVVLYRKTPAGASDTFSLKTFQTLKAPPSAVRSVAAELTRFEPLQDGSPRLSWGPEARPLRATAVSSGFFETLQVPLRGRGPGPADDLHADAVAVISDRFWRHYLSADTSVIGRRLKFGEAPITVTGIAPKGFHGPRVGDDFDVWLNLGGLSTINRTVPGPFTAPNVTIYARLTEGATSTVATSLVASLLQRAGSEPPFFRPIAEAAYPPQVETRRAEDQRLFAFLGTMSVVMLLIACVNLISLELSKWARSGGERRVRVALGATPSAVVRPVIAMSIVAVAVGSLGSLVVGYWTLRSLGAMLLPSGLELASLHVSFDLRIWAAVVTMCVVASVGSAVLPLSRVRRTTFAMQSPRSTVGSALLAVHVCVTVVLLIGSIMFGRTVYKSLEIELGFDADETFGVFVQPRLDQFESFEARASEFRWFLQRLVSDAGATAATSGPLPLRPTPPQAETATTSDRLQQRRVGASYAVAAGLRLAEGRDLDEPDTVSAAPVPVLINKAAARSFQPPLTVGRTFEMAQTQPSEKPEVFLVVGIVEDATRVGIWSKPLPIIYRPTALDGRHAGQVMLDAVARVREPRSDTVERILRLGREMFPSATRLQVTPATRVVHSETRTARLASTVFAGWALVSAGLAFVSVFGVTALTVLNKTQELAVRIALGAPFSHLARTASSAGVVPVLWGCGAGIVASRALSPVIEHYVFEVTSIDPMSYLIAIAAVLLTTLGACAVPVRRALTINPTNVLRHD